MFGKVVRSLSRGRRGRTLLAGAIGVLTGVESLFATRASRPARIEPAPAPVRKPEVASKRQPCIKIRQTKSELGYVYWVLQQCGSNPSYALFDTWREAMDEASRRIAAAEPVLVSA